MSQANYETENILSETENTGRPSASNRTQQKKEPVDSKTGHSGNNPIRGAQREKTE